HGSSAAPPVPYATLFRSGRAQAPGRGGRSRPHIPRPPRAGSARAPAAGTRADERGPRGRSTSTGPLGQQLGGSAALLDVCLQLGQPQLARAGALGHLLVLALGVPRVDLAGPTD